MKRLIGLCLAWSLVSSTCAVADDGTSVVVTQADESKFPEITVYFGLRGPQGAAIRDAKREAFRVVEDGKDRPIEGFDAPLTVEKRATTVVLVVDRSGSMLEEGKMDGLRSAVKSFLKDLPPGSKVAVVAFGSQVVTACPLTDDLNRAIRAVDALEPFGATRFYDAVAKAVELLQDQPGRRVILALTDGEDTASRGTDLAKAIELARRANLPIHTLGLGRDGEIDAKALRELAESTRGRFYLAESADALRKIYEEIAERLGASYRITYRTDRPIRDGTLRPIEIFHAESRSAGTTTVFIPGMVVPAVGWSRLFVGLIAALVVLAFLPGRFARRTTEETTSQKGPPVAPGRTA